MNVTMSVLVAVTIMWVIRQAGLVFAPAALGLFLLARRFADSLSNLIQVGMPYALTRFLAMNPDARVQARYLELGTGTAVATGMLALIVVLASPAWWTSLLFPPGTPPEAAIITVVLTLSLSFSNLAMSSLTAFRRFVYMNLVSLANGSVWMLLALYWWGTGSSVWTILGVHALAAIVLSIGVLAILWIRRRARLPVAHGNTTTQTHADARAFLTYGLPRTFSPFVETLLFVLAAWLLRSEPADAGYLILAFTLLRIANMTLAPIGAVAAVTTAQLQGSNQAGTVRKGVNLLAGSFLYFGILVFALGYPWVHLTLVLWLRSPSLATSVYAYGAVMFLALVPYIAFQGLKQIIDMLWISPRNLYTSSLGLLSMLVVYGATGTLLPLNQRVLVGSAVGIFTTGILSTYWIRRYLERPAYFGLYRLLPIAFLVGSVNWFAASTVSHASLLTQTGAAALSVIASATLGALLLAPKRAPFLGDAMQFFRPGGRDTIGAAAGRGKST